MGETSQAAEFDGGPLHEATLMVELDGAELPPIVWTDAGDCAVTYTLNGDMWTYRYAGVSLACEISACPRVPAPVARP